jgi:hypothetical protein
MSVSRTTLRLITLLFLLAGLLLLRKPFFGEAIHAAPTRFIVIQGLASGKGADVSIFQTLQPGDTDLISVQMSANFSHHRKGHPQRASVWRSAGSSLSEKVAAQ